MNLKTCTVCGVEKETTEFYSSTNGCKYGAQSQCKACRRPYMSATKNKRKLNKRSFVVDLYCAIVRRTEGKLKGKEHLYEGLRVMDRETFIEWSLKDSDFNKLHHQWVVSKHDRNLTPSVNRKINLLGYVEGNIGWCTKRENDLDGLESARIMRTVKKQIL